MSAIASNHTAISFKALRRSQTMCRYYVRGICLFGDLCRFSHDPSSGSPGDEVVVPATEIPRPRGANFSIKDWANAPEFVPRHRQIPLAQGQSEGEMNTDMNSYPSSAGGTADFRPVVSWAEIVGKQDFTWMGPATLDKVCPYDTIPCIWGEYCPYRIHMELCDMCQQYCLHPTDQDQRKKHIRECLEEHEQAMEWSFAIARSRDKTCGICFDTILEKTGREKRFGILPNCSHVFCLECIRTWRRAEQFDNKVTRACPECRVCSDFVYPSAFWVEAKEEKDKLLKAYRTALGNKDCKYFKNGEGRCPFGNNCFYKHALPEGDVSDVGQPSRPQSPESPQSQSDIIGIMNTIDLWELNWMSESSSDYSESSSNSEEEEEEE